MTCVVNERRALVGIITDGDLRRQIEKGVDVRGLTAADVMTRGPISVPGTTLAAEALNIMETRHITSLIVVDGASGQVAGIVHLHDLWRTEMF
jgi:arabinose-5-phosphate isomerase